MRVLVVEDEEKLATLIARGLREGGHAVDVAHDGQTAIWKAGSAPYDALVLDVGLPDLDGFEVCRRLRADGVWTPVLMLTARDAVADRIAGLDGGADDYMTKPFAPAELVARLRALARRGAEARPSVLESGGVWLDPATREVRRDGRPVELSTREFAMLEAFMRSPGLVLSRLQLLEKVWDDGYENRSNVVDVYVHYLREKLGADAIETVRGVGYRMR